MGREKQTVNELDQIKILVFWFASTLNYYTQNTVMITSSTEPINLPTDYYLYFFDAGAMKSTNAIPSDPGAVFLQRCSRVQTSSGVNSPVNGFWSAVWESVRGGSAVGIARSTGCPCWKAREKWPKSSSARILQNVVSASVTSLAVHVREWRYSFCMLEEGAASYWLSHRFFVNAGTAAAHPVSVCRVSQFLDVWQGSATF